MLPSWEESLGFLICLWGKDMMVLCDKCNKEMARRNFVPDIYPWVHCHHEEEVRPCPVCGGLVPGEKVVMYGQSMDFKFCPNCGRVL
jgi:NAD-dependent SIR2 family protein deacetylase